MTASPQQTYPEFDATLPEIVHTVGAFTDAGDPGALVALLRDWQINESGDSAVIEAALRETLTEAGWPVELHDEALRVAWCESRWETDALGIGGTARGLFQIHLSPWFPYAGEPAESWADPLVNARVGWAVYQYDISRGQPAWTQWTCKP